MNYLNLRDAVAALEDFEEKVAEAVSTPTEEEVDASNNQGELLQKEMDAVDNDVQNLSDRTEQVGEVMEMVEKVDGDNDEPLPEPVQKGVDIALEAMGLGLEADDPAKESKKTMWERLKAFLSGLMDMLRRFGKRLIEMAKAVYAYATDRSVRNKKRAEKAKEVFNSKEFKEKTKKDGKPKYDNARDVFGDRLMKSMATPTGMSVGKAVDNLIDYVRGMNRVMGRDAVLEAAHIFDEIITDPTTTSSGALHFLKILEKIGEESTGTADGKMYKEANQDPNLVKMRVSGPLFTGYRFWVSVPKSIHEINNFWHGLTVLDDVKPWTADYPIPSINYLQDVNNSILELDRLIGEYRSHVAELNKFDNKLEYLQELSKNARGAGKDFDGSKMGMDSASVRQLITAMNVALPKLVKGPNVAAIKYASEVGSMLASYVEAGTRAYTGNAHEAK